ncbi:hypothetical protein B0J12DRAFT_187101 [Macrophomina phaseolina]|uniref:Uncharacterized protein n=1 Tax=Macrophomina phaseolina TaxID=35725 RepID=A0ABQ8G3U1_9PEZI|nr:hypothetical protein B0J12DRAFT_187101 [Macrophomina phaseolina]
MATCLRLEHTTNRSIARDTFSDYCSYQWNDTITLYFNITHGIRCDCLSTVPADSDIAGIGVMASYSIISLITTLVAVIPAFFDTTTDQRAKLRRLTNPKQPTASPENHVRPEQMPALLCFCAVSSWVFMRCSIIHQHRHRCARLGSVAWLVLLPRTVR